MGAVLPMTPEIAHDLAKREAGIARREARRHNFRRRGFPLLLGVTTLAAAATFVAVQSSGAAEQPAPAVSCAGEGQVSEGKGYISAVADANTDYRLGMSDSEVFDYGATLFHKADRQPRPNEWVHIGRTAAGELVVGLGSCESANLPLVLPSAS